MPSKYMQEEYFVRITKMSQRYRISKEELLGVKVHRPYACKTTYHYDHRIYETEGYCM